MAHVSRVHRRGRLRSIATALAAASFILAGTTSVVAAADPPPIDPPPPLQPIDPQIVTQSADQDWTDYHPIPGSPYVDSSIVPTIERFNVALILTDFPGTPFAITQPEGSTVFGNPGPLAHDIPRDAVPAFYVDWMNNPSAINEYQGMNRYWMEDTYGKYGVALSGYGPYLLPGTQDEYFITDFTNTSYCNTQTRTAATAQTNVTDVEVVSSASFSVGKIVTGLVAGNLSRVVTAIPDATHLTTGRATIFSAASVAGATNIKVASVADLAVGHTIDIGFDDRLETRTIASVGTAGSGGTGVNLTAPLTFAHAQNTIVRDMTATPIASVAGNAFVHSCGRSYRNETLVAWADHVSQAERTSFDNTFYVSAGQDESGTWQEFGEMMFTQTTVPDAWGPPNPEIPQNWAGTRYIPWTSWASAASNWPSASGNNSIEGEGSGMAVYAHELTHNLGIGDNYNNPYASPFQRAATGYWSMMSRGSFQGPGGTHTRWHIPSTMGTALGSQHVIRDKIVLGFVSPANYLDLNRDGLAASGLAVLDVVAREVDPGATGQTGVRINLDGTAPVDHNTSCTVTVAAGNALTCSGTANFRNYTMEVVQQVGSDSFQADQGVLIEKNKISSSSCGTFSCFAWVIDAHPEDINLVDFVRPDGTTQVVTTGDPRQLTDAPFHAGTDSGSSYEWEDTANGLHFYVVDRHLSDAGVLSYTLAVRNINGSGPQVRGVSVADTPQQSVVARWATCDFPLTNTGSAAAIPGTPHPEDASAYLNNDVYRLSTAVTGSGWQAQLANLLVTASFGQTVQVPVYVTRDLDSADTASVTLTATSESDPTKTSTGTCALAIPYARAWVGLKNGDDQGTQFDVKFELFRNAEATPVASGLVRCVTGVTRNPNLAKQVSTRWNAYDGSGLEPGDALSIVVSARIGTNADGTKCAGHASAVGLRLYYDAVSRPSGFGATAGYTDSTLYLDSDGNVCNNAESTGVTDRYLNPTPPDATAAKCKDAGAVKYVGGNLWSTIGSWHSP
jgi:M6 family metalloprotease-like protein